MGPKKNCKKKKNAVPYHLKYYFPSVDGPHSASESVSESSDTELIRKNEKRDPERVLDKVSLNENYELVTEGG